MIQVTPAISIDENDLHEEFILSSGPGGQNVNKVSTAVRLHFQVASPCLPEAVRQRLLILARSRITAAGELIIEARRFRTQPANRQDALDRLVELIRNAAREPRPHHKTRPTLGSKERRLAAKRRRGETKQLRKSVSSGTDE